jgi:HK97 family phage portal protein
VGLRAFLRGDNITLGIDGSEDRSLERSTIPQNVWDAWVQRSRPMRSVTRENALAVATAWSCVKLLADSIAPLPVRVYRRLADGSRIPAGPDQRLAQLLARPWPGATSIDLISMIVMHLSLYGEAWVAKYTSEGSIIGLGLIHPSRMQIYMVGNTVTYALDGDNSYGPNDIILIRGLCMNGLRGISPVQSVSNAFELNENLRESSRQFFLEGSRPSGILKAPEGASLAAINALREDWRNLYSGAGGIDHMHRTAVISGDMSFTPITFSLSDQEFLASREFSVREIAAIFSLPAWAVNGDSGSSLTYANTTQQAQFLV